MSFGTGCVSFGVPTHTSLRVERVVECFSVEPESRTCRIWADVFVDNPGGLDQSLYVIHRGNLVGRHVTRESWCPPSLGPLTARIVRLHERSEPIRIGAEKVAIGGQEYSLWTGPDGVLPAIVGQTQSGNVPFTMWELGPFRRHARQLVRVNLVMTKESYEYQVGNATEFFAYGDAILLDRIAEDLQTYEGLDCERYERAIANLAERVVPEIYEYLLVSLSDSSIRWKTLPLSPGFSPQFVPPEYSDSTHWFIARQGLHVSKFNLSAKNTSISSAFVVKVNARLQNVASDVP